MTIFVETSEVGILDGWVNRKMEAKPCHKIIKVFYGISIIISDWLKFNMLLIFKKGKNMHINLIRRYRLRKGKTYLWRIAACH